MPLLVPRSLRWLFPAPETGQPPDAPAPRVQEQINPTYAASSPTEEDWYWGRFATGDEEDYYWRRLSDNWVPKRCDSFNVPRNS